MAKIRRYVQSQLPRAKGPLFPVGPLLVVYHFRIPMICSYRGVKRRLKHFTPHYRRPDADNMEKLVNDALNGLIWRDDSQISWILRTKSILDAKIGSTLVYVCPLSPEHYNYDQILELIKENIRIDADELYNEADAVARDYALEASQEVCE